MKKLCRFGDFLGVDQHVVQAGRGDAGQVRRRDRGRVQLAEEVAGFVEVVDELHGLAGGDAEPERLALADGLALADPLDLAAVLLDGYLELGEVVFVLRRGR